MSGNVYEKVEDCGHETYQGAPRDGSAWLAADGGDCGLRAIRGGSWLNEPGYLRASARGRNLTDDRGPDIGFRLAQDTP